MQMALTGVRQCYFVVYADVHSSQPSVRHQLIEFDSEEWKNTEEKLINFYRSFAFPRLVAEILDR